MNWLATVLAFTLIATVYAVSKSIQLYNVEQIYVKL